MRLLYEAELEATLQDKGGFQERGLASQLTGGQEEPGPKRGLECIETAPVARLEAL